MVRRDKKKKRKRESSPKGSSDEMEVGKLVELEIHPPWDGDSMRKGGVIAVCPSEKNKDTLLYRQAEKARDNARLASDLLVKKENYEARLELIKGKASASSSEPTWAAKFEARLNKMETEAAELKTEAAELKTEAAELKTKVAELETKVAELETKNGVLTVENAALKQRVTGLEASIHAAEALYTRRLFDCFRRKVGRAAGAPMTTKGNPVFGWWNAFITAEGSSQTVLHTLGAQVGQGTLEYTGFGENTVQADANEEIHTDDVAADWELYATLVCKHKGRNRVYMREIYRVVFERDAEQDGLTRLSVVLKSVQGLFSITGR